MSNKHFKELTATFDANLEKHKEENLQCCTSVYQETIPKKN